MPVFSINTRNTAEQSNGYTRFSLKHLVELQFGIAANNKQDADSRKAKKIYIYILMQVYNSKGYF